MTSSEWEEEAYSCCDCGGTLWPESERAFACGPGSFLCFACTEKRGGVFDEGQDRWVVDPDVTGLPDERRPHS